MDHPAAGMPDKSNWFHLAGSLAGGARLGQRLPGKCWSALRQCADLPLGGIALLGLTLPKMRRGRGLEEGQLVAMVVGHALGVALDRQEEGMVWLGRGSLFDI